MQRSMSTEERLTTSLKVYFSVEKFQILLQQDSTRTVPEEIELIREDVL